MNEELKPCPHCGARLIHGPIGPERHGWEFICGGCGSETIFKNRTESQAIAAWNTRAHPGAVRYKLRNYI